jgi:hypothetical protein
MKIFSCFSARLLWLLIPVCGAAQSQIDEDILQVDFGVVGLSAAEVRGLYYDSLGESIPLRLSPAYVSSGYRYQGPSPLVIYRKEENQNGEVVKVPAASVDIPVDWMEVLLFFAKSGEGISYRVFVVDGREDSFPPGSYRLYNLTSGKVRGRIGSEVFSIPPEGVSQIVTDAESGERLDVVLLQRKDGEWKREIQTVWFFRPETRSIGFLFDGKQGRLELKVISQHGEIGR